MQIKRPTRPGPLISLVPMIDVMLILLVFFMVTSTYLNLDMIPAAKRGEAQTDAPTATEGSGAGAGTLLIRIGADGVPVLRGQWQRQWQRQWQGNSTQQRRSGHEQRRPAVPRDHQLPLLLLTSTMRTRPYCTASSRNASFIAARRGRAASWAS